MFDESWTELTGADLKAEREAARITQKTLGRFMPGVVGGVSQQFIAVIEAYELPPDATVLRYRAALAAATAERRARLRRSAPE